MPYTDGFKARMVKRMGPPEDISATELAKKVGVSQPTLSRWMRQAGSLQTMDKDKQKSPEGDAAKRRSWTAEEKVRVVFEASSVGSGLGEGHYRGQTGASPGCGIAVRWEPADSAGLG